MSDPWQSQAEAQEYNKLCTDIVKDPNNDYLKILDHVSFAEGSKVLDLGCGTGNITFKLAERVGSKGQVIGVDPDKARIQVAQENNTLSNVTFLVGDGEKGLPQDKFDVVFCNYVMGSIENKRTVFENVAKVVRPGGQFIIVAITDLPEIALELARLMGPEREDLVNKMWFYPPATIYDDLAAATGFSVSVKEKDDARYLYTVDSLKSSWFAVTHGRFDPALADKTALEEFEKKYADQEVEWKLSIARYILVKS